MKSYICNDCDISFVIGLDIELAKAQKPGNRICRGCLDNKMRDKSVDIKKFAEDYSDTVL
jgi:hypothetical protein